MNDENLTILEGIIDHTFVDKSLGYTALGACPDHSAMLDKVRVFALLGDRITRAVLTSDLAIGRYSSGHIHNTVENIVNNANLSKVASQIGISELLILHPSQQGSRPGRKTIATAMEAIVGAVFVDSGYDFMVAGAVVNNMGLGIPVRARKGIDTRSTTTSHDGIVAVNGIQARS